MKNKNEKCCGKINGMNVFIGLLMGIAVLVFGWKVYLQQHPAPKPQVLDSMKIDQALEKVKKDESKTMDFAGTWKSEGENPTTLGLNADGTVADMDGATWKSDKIAEETTVTILNADGTTEVYKFVDGNLVMGEIILKK